MFTGPGGGKWTSLEVIVLPTTAGLCVLDGVAPSRSPCKTEALISPVLESVGSWQISAELLPGNCPLLKRIASPFPEEAHHQWLVDAGIYNEQSLLSEQNTSEGPFRLLSSALAWQRTLLWLYCSSCVILLSLPPTCVGPEDTPPPLSFLPANLHLRVCF